METRRLVLPLFLAWSVAVAPAARAAESAAVRGTLAGTDGRPVAGRAVASVPSGGGRPVADVTDAEGGFVFSGLGGGRYVLSSGAPDGAPAVSPPFDLDAFERILVRLRLVGESGHEGLVLEALLRDPSGLFGSHYDVGAGSFGAGRVARLSMPAPAGTTEAQGALASSSA